MDIFSALMFPPTAFIIALLFVMSLFEFLARRAPAPKTGSGGGGLVRPPQADDGGEDAPHKKAAADYLEFLPSAVFFTLLHAAALMVATWSMNQAPPGLETVIAYAASAAVILALMFI